MYGSVLFTENSKCINDILTNLLPRSNRYQGWNPNEGQKREERLGAREETATAGELGCKRDSSFMHQLHGADVKQNAVKGEKEEIALWAMFPQLTSLLTAILSFKIIGTILSMYTVLNNSTYSQSIYHAKPQVTSDSLLLFRFQTHIIVFSFKMIIL